MSTITRLYFSQQREYKMQSVIIITGLILVGYIAPASADVYDCIMSGHIGCAGMTK